MIKERNDEYFINKMSVLGKLMWWSYAIEIFRDGDGGSFVYNKYHPFTYILMLFSIVMLFTMEGWEGLSREWGYNKLCWDFTNYWKKPENEIVYIKRINIIKRIKEFIK